MSGGMICAVRIFALILIVGVAACTNKPAPFNAIDITGIQGYGTDIRLTDHTGKPCSLADFKGKVVAVFFGFTNCPDVCPTTLADMRTVMTQLGPDAERLQVLFVSVDPKRDTTDVLSRYVPSFHPSFLGLTGSAEAVAKVASDFKIFVREQPGKTPETYTVDHSAGMLVFDPSGRLRLFVNHGMPPEKMTPDFKRLMKDVS
jgi:protein SCO1